MTVREAVHKALRGAGYHPVEEDEEKLLWEHEIGQLFVVVPRLDPLPPFLAEKILKHIGLSQRAVERLLEGTDP